jgi:hypothetical protein
MPSFEQAIAIKKNHQAQTAAQVSRVSGPAWASSSAYSVSASPGAREQADVSTESPAHFFSSGGLAY